MATKRDVELGISASVTGLEAVKKLKDEVEALAKEGGDAAPEFQKLGAELDKLGDQAQALNNLNAIVEDIERLGTEATEAKTKTDALGQAFQAIKGDADGFRAAQDSAAKELRQAQESLVNTRLELARYKAEQRDAIGDTTAYKNTVKDLQLQIIAAREAIAAKTSALRDAKVATAEAEAAETKAARALNQSTKENNSVVAALQQREKAQREAIDTLQQLGVETTDLTRADQQLAAAMQAVQREVQATTDYLALQRAEAERLEAAKREAAAAAELEAQRTAAIQRQAASDYEQFWLSALNKVEAAGKETEQSLGTLGVKSVAELRAEINRVNTSLETLRNNGTLSGAELRQATKVAGDQVKDLERQIRAATGELTLMDRATNLFRTSFGQTFGAFVASEVLMKIVDSVRRLGEAFLTANKDLESFRLALRTVYKDAEVAEQQLDFLRETASNSGQSVGDLSASFVKFSASMQTANIPISQTNELFASLAQTAGTLGLSADQTQRAIDALGQIAAKGTVSMEELRQQLGDALPGALSIAANGLGVTEQQLIKLVESGNLAARDFIPGFTNGLKTVSGEVDTFQSNLNDLKNLFAQFLQSIGDAGVWEVLKGALKGVTVLIGPFVIGLNTILESLGATVKMVAAFTGTLAGGGGLMDALRAANAEFDASVARQLTLIDTYKRVAFGADEVKSAVEKQTAEIVKLGVKYSELEASAAANVELAKAQGETQTELAGITKQVADAFGNEQERLDAATAAANANLEAKQRVAAAEAVELQTMRDKLAQMLLLFEQERLANEQSNLTVEQQAKIAEGRRKQIQDLVSEIALKDQQVAKTNAQVLAADAAARAASLEAQANKDNAARVAELNIEYQNAQKNLEGLLLLKRSGNATDAEIVAATNAVKDAQTLLNDALRDAANLRVRNAEASRLETDVKTGAVRVAIAEQQAILEIARAKGDEYAVKQATAEITKLEIELAKLNAQAKRAEAEAALALAEATRADLIAKNEWTAASEASYRASLAKVEVLRQEAQISEITAQKMAELERITRLSGDSATSATGKFDRMSNSLDGVAGSAATAARNIRDLTNAELERMDRYGRVGSEAGQELERRRNATSSNTGSMDQVPTFGTTAELDAWWEQQQVARRQNLGTVGSASSKAWTDAIWGWAEAEYKAQRQSLESKPTTAATQTQQQSQSRTININLNGSTTRVNVASDADATALENLLQQLASAKGRS